jgi:hypothetical protein
MARSFSPAFLSLSLLCALALSGCETLNPAQRRIKQSPELFAGLSEKEKALVDQGEIEEGMSRDAVYLAWGRPGRVMNGSREGQTLEKWTYFRQVPVHTTSVGFGSYPGYPMYPGYGVHPAARYAYGTGRGISTGTDYLPSVARTVEFVRDQVVAWERID